LTIVQSKTNSSFHTLEGCLSLQGFQFQENSKDSVIMTGPNWAQGKSSTTIPLNRLVITKATQDGSIYERRLILFFYVKGNQYYSDMTTLIEVEGLIPLQGSYSGTLTEEQEFLSQAIPLMFEPSSNSGQWHPLITRIAEKGVLGFAAIAIMILIPLSLIALPLIRRREVSK
jgi:hypothetical protein